MIKTIPQNRYLAALKNVLLTSLACLAATIIVLIQIAILGNDMSGILIMNPMTSGYLHSGLEHFGLNMIILFLALLPDINKKCDPLKLFFITTLISLIYVPIEILGLTENAVGISGTCYFLLSRYFFSWNKKKWLGASIIVLLVVFEFSGFFGPSDGSAHGVHLIGIFLGFLSLRMDMGEILSIPIDIKKA